LGTEILNKGMSIKTLFIEALKEATRLWWGKGSRIKKGPVCYDVIPVFWAAEAAIYRFGL